MRTSPGGKSSFLKMPEGTDPGISLEFLRGLHELPQVEHPAEKSVPLESDVAVAAFVAPLVPLREEFAGAGGAVERFHATAELGFGDGPPFRHLEKKVDVVVEKRVGERLDAGKARNALQDAEQGALVGIGFEKEPCAGGFEDDVAVAGTGSEESRRSHGGLSLGLVVDAEGMSVPPDAPPDAMNSAKNKNGKCRLAGDIFRKKPSRIDRFTRSGKRRLREGFDYMDSVGGTDLPGSYVQYIFIINGIY